MMLKRRIKRWPYILVSVIIDAVFLAILLMLNLIPKEPYVGGFMVFVYFFIFSLVDFGTAYLLYRNALLRNPVEEEVRGISLVTDDQARNLLIERANRMFKTNFVADHEISEGRSLRVGSENTDTYVFIAKEDVFPSERYIILAVCKEDVSRWNYKVLTGLMAGTKCSTAMKEIAETLASKPLAKQVQTIERINPVTGESIITTITRPSNIQAFAKEQIQKEELV